MGIYCNNLVPHLIVWLYVLIILGSTNLYHCSGPYPKDVYCYVCSGVLKNWRSERFSQVLSFPFFPLIMYRICEWFLLLQDMSSEHLMYKGVWHLFICLISCWQIKVIETLGGSSSKKKGRVDVDKMAVLAAWHRVNCRTREALRRSFLAELIESYEVVLYVKWA